MHLNSLSRIPSASWLILSLPSRGERFLLCIDKLDQSLSLPTTRFLTSLLSWLGVSGVSLLLRILAITSATV